MPQRVDLDWRSFGPFSFPIFYGQKMYNAWTGDTVQLATSLLGTSILLYLLLKLVLAIRIALRPSTLQAYCHSQTGSWALVTGASDGIGRAFVDELLERGFNVLLHGRNHDKLERVTTDLAQQYPRRSVDFVVADASKSDHPEAAVIEKVKHLPGKLTILVNNVGGVHKKPTFAAVEQTSAEDIDTLINVNNRFPTQLISGLLPTLKQSQPSLIINCGSASSDVVIPYLAIYSATKAYIHILTRTLKAELLAEAAVQSKPCAFEVQGYVIGSTRSAGNTDNIPFITLGARECARGCLAKVGSGRALESPHWRHAAAAGLIRCIPESMLTGMMFKEVTARNEKFVKGE